MTNKPPIQGLPIDPITARLPGHIRPSSDENAAALGIPVAAWRQMRRSGLVPVDLADTVANAVHEHPGVLWPAEWRQAVGVD